MGEAGNIKLLRRRKLQVDEFFLGGFLLFAEGDDVVDDGEIFFVLGGVLEVCAVIIGGAAPASPLGLVKVEQGEEIGAEGVVLLANFEDDFGARGGGGAITAESAFD